MGKLKEITVSISRKLSDDNYGSFGVQAAITLEVEEGENKDELYLASASWLSEKVAGTHKAHGTLSSQSMLDDPPAPVPPVKTIAATPVPAGAVAKTAQPTDGVVAGELTFVVETLSVEAKGGKRYVKAKGGNFNVYGVNVWPEVLALPPIEWVADELDGADYPAPAGLTAIYVEKEIVGKQGEPKFVPDKVTGWK